MQDESAPNASMDPVEATPLLSRPVQSADVVGAYAVFLGREAESPEAIADKVGMTRGQLLRQFITSGEFEDRLVRPAIEGRLPSGAIFDSFPPPATLAWAAGFLPLSSVGRSKLPRAPSWVAAHDIIFSDGELARALPTLTGLFAPSRFSEQLSALSRSLGDRVLIGEVEEASGLFIRGWAMDRHLSTVPVAVELWIDGVFVAATLADEFRRDLQDRFDSAGAHGFIFEGFSAPNADSERPVRVQIRESASKALLGAKTVTWSPERDATQLAQLAKQLEAAQAALRHIETAIKKVSGAFGFTLARYDDYRRAYYLTTPASREAARLQAKAFAARPLTVIVVVPARAQDELAKTLASLRSQTYRDFRLVLLGEHQDGAAASDAALASAFTAPDAQALGELLGEDYVVVIDAGDRLADDALHAFAAALQTGAPALLYGDSDTIETAPNGHERFVAPVLRPGYDPDLLLQSPYMGDVVVISAERLRAAIDGPDAMERSQRGLLVLKAIENTALSDIVHLPRVLYHQAADRFVAAPGAYDLAVAEHLQRAGGEAVVTSHTDSQATPLPGVARVVWPLRSQLKASVIIPTRDRLDLLGPCLASLLGAKAANTVELDITVVDNASTSAATQRFLNALDLAGRIRLIKYDAPFNWSAINNHAARNVNADVLIFLNNDTVVLSQDWSDELCRQAVRPEVGAVGARLLYEDGTIQHAGIVLGSGESLIAHEGAGAASSDAGYLGRRSLVHRTAAVTGACLATRADVFAQMGGFDEDRLAVEANDIDYCLRVRRAGLAVIYDPYCTLYHFESKSRGQTFADAARRDRAAKELATLQRRWGDALAQDPYYNPHFDRGARPFSRLGPLPD